MAIAAQTSSANEVVTLAAGTFTGHILVSHAGCTIRGAGIGRSIVQLDGTYAEGVRAGASVADVTLEDLTIDANQNATVSVVLEIGGGIDAMTATRVQILDHQRGAIAVYNRGVVTLNACSIIGSGAGINHFTASTSCVVRGLSIVGGQYGFQNTAASGIDIDGVTSIHDYWASPTYEAVTATGYGSTYADVASHVSGDRTIYDVMRYMTPVTTFLSSTTLRSELVQVWDRVETGDAWTQVIRIRPGNAIMLDEWRAIGLWRPTTPTGTATVYRVTLGRYLTGTSTRLNMQSGGAPTSPRWRSVTGATMSTPTTGGGSRLDIIRVGGSNRDVDTGACHITSTATNASVKRWTARGGWSDQITLRGTGTVAEECFPDLGQDMGFTVDGTTGRVTVRRCQATRTGRTGFHLTGGPSDLLACAAYDNGTLNDGSGDYGFTTTAACAGSTMQVTGARNLDGLIAGEIDEATHAYPRSNADKWRRRRVRGGG